MLDHIIQHIEQPWLLLRGYMNLHSHRLFTFFAFPVLLPIAHWYVTY
uniref:Uncharacterized protein n=1 Tax=uncultured gamma proteobacterium HF0010_01E20 TaxID=710977 RepID=E0XQ85_9GAMM|nr:hypothetical protein [uncultured gamma proteobacterium HF0010_01E20]